MMGEREFCLSLRQEITRRVGWSKGAMLQLVRQPLMSGMQVRLVTAKKPFATQAELLSAETVITTADALIKQMMAGTRR